MSNYIDRMEEELAQLEERVVKAVRFLALSGEVEKLDKEDVELLEQQVVAMTAYAGILETRLKRARNK